MREFEPILVGATYSFKLALRPAGGWSEADVTSFLSGAATAVADLMDLDDSSSVATVSLSVDAATRTLTGELTAAASAALTAGRRYSWRIRVTSAAGRVAFARVEPSVPNFVPVMEAV